MAGRGRPSERSDPVRERATYFMQYEVGAVVEGIVVDVVKFGAFVKLAGGKTGLVHISQISDKYVQEITEHVSVGAKALVKIISIDDKNRIQLSMKAVSPEDEEKHKAEQADSAGKKAAQRQERQPERHFREERPQSERRHEAHEDDSFDRKLKMFLRQSEDRLVDVKRGIDAKRGIKRKKTK